MSLTVLPNGGMNKGLSKALVGLRKWRPWFHTEPSKAMTETQTSWHSIHLGSTLASPLCTGGSFSIWWSQMRRLKGIYTGWDQGDGQWGWEQNVNSITSPMAELNISSAQPTFAKHGLCARYLWIKALMRCGPWPWKIHMGVWKMAISVLSQRKGCGTLIFVLSLLCWVHSVCPRDIC